MTSGCLSAASLRLDAGTADNSPRHGATRVRRRTRNACGTEATLDSEMADPPRLPRPTGAAAPTERSRVASRARAVAERPSACETLLILVVLAPMGVAAGFASSTAVSSWSSSRNAQLASQRHTRAGLPHAARAQVLLMDEWFLAGDAGFFEKARARLEDMVRGAEILVLATHPLGAIAVMNWCTRVLWMEQGRIREDGGRRRRGCWRHYLGHPVAPVAEITPETLVPTGSPAG